MSVLKKLLAPSGLALLVCCTSEKNLGERSEPSPNDDAGASTSDGSSTGEPFVAIVEGRAFKVAKALPGPVAAGGKKELFYVSVRAKNVDADPFAVLFADFTIGTTDGLLVSPAADQLTELVEPCTGQVQIDKGGELSCVIAFEIGVGTAKELEYQLPSGKTARITLPPRLCNTLEPVGQDITDVVKKALPAVPSGGSTDVPDGLYVLARTTLEESSTTRSSVGTVSFRIAKGRFELLSTLRDPDLGDQTEMRTFGSVEVAGKGMKLRSECMAQGTMRTDRIDEEPQPLLTALDHAYFADERKLVILTDHSFSEYTLAE